MVEPTKPVRLHQPATGGPVSSSLDRSASYRTPPTHPPKLRPLDRANTTRTPGTKVSPPQSQPLAKSHSQQANGSRGRTEPAPPAQGSAAAALARQHTQGKQQHQQQQQGATPRRREKAKENEEVIRQLQAICSPGDPNGMYRGLSKIGQG